MATDLIHGSMVSYQPELRTTTGEYGVLDEEAGPPIQPIMLWPGLNASFGVDVEKTYEEIPHTPAHGDTHILECVRNVMTGEKLAFGLTTYPQKGMDFPLLPFITGAAGGLGDEPDSTSWLKELNGQFSMFTGVMFEDYKAEIPALGAMKETISGFAGHRAAIVEVDPVTTHATENEGAPLTWADIVSIKLGEAGTEDILHCVSDISYGFTSEIDSCVHPESALTTKLHGVRVVARKMFVSLKLKYASQTFIDAVVTPTKQILTLVIKADSPYTEATTLTFGGLYFPKYIAKAESKTLIGDTITSISDQPTFTIATAAI